MKLSKHLRLLHFLQLYHCFTIKDVVAVTRSNNPYRTVEHLKDHIREDGIGFRIYYITKQAALDLIGRHGWRIAA